MLQSILSLMLAAVQVLAWNAAPVYLCLEADGSACVDRGPAFCDCCHSGESGDRSHGEHRCGDACAEHGDRELASTSGEPSVDNVPCGCEHEQISEVQSAVKGRDGSFRELTANPLDAAPVADVVPVSAPSDHFAGVVQDSCSSSALAARAGVVLRL